MLRAAVITRATTATAAELMCVSASFDPRQAMLNVIPGRTLTSCGGLGPTYLGVRAAGGLAKSWSQRLRINGKPCNLGLRRYPIVALAEARDKALENARAVAQGSEPRDRSRVPTFKQAATGTRSAGSGRRSRSASGSSGARPTWTASERSGPW